jgi:tetratricopeptide (TPR) repeat protein
MADDRGGDPMDRKRRFSRRNLLRRLAGQGEDGPGAGGLGFDSRERQAGKLLAEERFDEALALYERVLEREPAHREALRDRGWCLWKLGQPSAARDSWRSLLTHYPGDHLAHLYTGLSYADEDRVAEALSAWKEFRDYRKVMILRQINLALFEQAEGEALDGRELVRRIEKAMDEQAHADDRG